MVASAQRIIAIVGATGNQGSSVANTFLKLSRWRVRAITRNPLSPAAQALAASGAEVVQADLLDIESLSKAFEGAHAIFVNTDFWATYKPIIAAIVSGDRVPQEGELSPSKIAYETELLHGKNAARAAAQTHSLERFIYSALPWMSKLSKGKYTQSHHWDAKGAIVDFIETTFLDLAAKSSFIYLGAYNTNAILSPRLDSADGKYKFILPLKQDTRMPIIDATVSTGPFVKALIEDESPGIKLLAYDSDSYLTTREFVDVWKRASGREASLTEVTINFMHENFGVPMELLEGPRFIVEEGYTGSMKILEPHHLKERVETRSFEEWMRARDWKEILKVDSSGNQSVKKETDASSK